MDFKKYTPAFILGTLALVFGYDTLASIFGSHATISEVSTSYILSHPNGFATLFFGLGILAYHFLDKALYK